jgi:hypothetical protein
MHVRRLQRVANAADVGCESGISEPKVVRGLACAAANGAAPALSIHADATRSGGLPQPNRVQLRLIGVWVREASHMLISLDQISVSLRIRLIT